MTSDKKSARDMAAVDKAQQQEMASIPTTADLEIVPQRRAEISSGIEASMSVKREQAKEAERLEKLKAKDRMKEARADIRNKTVARTISETPEAKRVTAKLAMLPRHPKRKGD